MDFKNLDFRKCENKWYIIKDKEEVEILDEITKNKQDGDMYVGYIYIDHYQGLSMFLLGKCKIENNKLTFSTKLEKLTENSFAMTNNIICSFDNFRVYNIDNISIQEDIKDVVEEFIYNEFYSEIDKKKHFILDYRKDVLEDVNRANQYPDSISFLLTKEGLENELIWGRVEGYHKGDKEVRAVLLDDPFEKKYNLVKGDVVGLVKGGDKFDGYIAVTGYKKDKKFKI